MNRTLRIDKNGTALYPAAHDICDADSFGRACAETWRNCDNNGSQ